MELAVDFPSLASGFRDLGVVSRRRTDAAPFHIFTVPPRKLTIASQFRDLSHAPIDLQKIAELRRASRTLEDDVRSALSRISQQTAVNEEVAALRRQLETVARRSVAEATMADAHSSRNRAKSCPNSTEVGHFRSTSAKSGHNGREFGRLLARFGVCLGGQFRGMCIEGRNRGVGTTGLKSEGRGRPNLGRSRSDRTRGKTNIGVAGTF